MPIILSEVEVRVLASLVEKQMTTPENYPLTLNSLTLACNQKTSREPVVNYDEETVTTALESLREQNLVYVFYGSNSRVAKYKHFAAEVLEVSMAEKAILCVLMLRGAQTVNEIQTRTNRMYEFSGLGEVDETLNALINRDSQKFVVRLPKQIGQKEIRYTHLLAGEPDLAALETAFTQRAERVERVGSADRIAALEQKVETLSAELQTLRETFEEFRKQFE